jgi:hypothetical protein
MNLKQNTPNSTMKTICTGVGRRHSFRGADASVFGGWYGLLVIA